MVLSINILAISSLIYANDGTNNLGSKDTPPPETTTLSVDVTEEKATTDRALIEEEFPGMPVAVCANLPYYITSPIVMKLLGDSLPIQNLTVMVQKEAADRLAAAPGTRASSAISCAVSYYATSKLMFTAAPGSFYPAPKVTSAVVRMDIRPTPAVQVEDEEGYFALIRAAFGQRRKTAANAIASGLGLPKDKVIAAIEAAGFDARIRPEALTLEDFAAVQRELK